MADGKICNRCREFKPYTLFYREKTIRDGYRGTCKNCEKLRKHLHYIKNREKYKKAYQEFVERNPDYMKKYVKYKKTPN